MQIHVVQSGDSLYSIAREYNVPFQELLMINSIEDPSELIIGQTIMIPVNGSIHLVKRGESLYTISQKHDIHPYELARVNGIVNPAMLEIGMSLYIPEHEKTKIETVAYIDLAITGKESASYVEEVGELLTYVNIFSYHVKADGTLTPLLGDEPVIQAAYSRRVAPLMVITNYLEGQFSRELATEILSNEEKQDILLTEALSIMQEKGYLGIDFDFEYLGAENREAYVEFLKKARSRLDEVDESYILTTALAPKIADNQEGILYEGHDYKAIGEIVDFIFVMTYEWGWSGGPPMAVSPLNEVRKVMQYALSVVPADKIMMGIPLYGYDWTLPFVKGGKFARAISFMDGVELAKKYNREILYDNKSQAPYFNYIDEEGKKHEVWFEDARSLQAKMDLVKELGIRGFFYWVLGRETPQNWILLQNNFYVNKIV